MATNDFLIQQDIPPFTSNDPVAMAVQLEQHLRRMQGELYQIWNRTAYPLGITFGDAPNQISFESDGNIVLSGTAMSYDDWQGQLASNQKVTPAADIVANHVEASVTFETGCSLSDYVYMSPQQRHKWNPGSAILPHLHWWQTTSDMPNWLLQYRWQANGEAKTTSWTYLPVTTNVFTYSAGTLNQITYSAALAAPSDYSISDIIQFRILRDVANTSTEFSGAESGSVDADAVSFDYHFILDGFGSNTEYSK